MRIKIPTWIALGLKFGLTAFRVELPKIIALNPDTQRDDIIRDGIELTTFPLEETVTVLSDDNEADKEQLAAIWKKFTSQKLTPYLQDSASVPIEKLSDEHLKAILKHFGLPAVGMVGLMTDDNPQNVAQIKSLWLAIIKDPVCQDIILKDFFEAIVLARIEPRFRSLALALLEVLIKSK